MNRKIKTRAKEFEKYSVSQLINHIQIAKVPLCFFVACSTLFGYLLVSRQLKSTGFLAFVSVFLLACGAASLNSYQEYRADRLMKRTRERPLARGVMQPAAALWQVRLLLGTGFFMLFACFETLGPVIAGVAAVLIYNGVYTPMKYMSIWAIVPGALCGALPPYIGWLCGGGDAGALLIGTVAVLFAVWQIPHFWLVVLENKVDYQAGNLPSVIKQLPERTVRMVSIVWVGALVSILHTLILMQQMTRFWLNGLVSFASLIVLAVFAWQMGLKKQPNYKFLFILLNGFMFLVMLAFCIGSLNNGAPIR